MSQRNASNAKLVLQVLTRLNLGGITHQVLLSSIELRSLGYEVQFVVGKCGEREHDCTPEIVAKGFTVHRIDQLSNCAGLLADVVVFLKLLKLFNSKRPHWVHLHMFKARVLGALAARLVGIPAIIETLHGHMLEGYYNKLLSWLVWPVECLVGWILTHRVVAISQGQYNELARYKIAPERKILIQHVGFDPEPFYNLEDFQTKLRRAHAIPLDSVVVGIMARLVPDKGIHDFLEAASLLNENQSHSIHFLIAGDGPLSAELHEKAEIFGLDHNCSFLGLVDDVRLFYAAIDVYVLSSWNEGTPIGLLEAMASAKAIVATDVGGVPDMVEHKESALLVPKQNPRALCQAITIFSHDANLREKYGGFARSRVRNFNIDALRNSMDKLYQELYANREAMTG